MTARSPQRPRIEKKGPTPKAPQNAPGEPTVDSAAASFEEVLAEYEQQIGALTGQLIQKNIALRNLKKERDSLRQELTRKREGSNEPIEEE